MKGFSNKIFIALLSAVLAYTSFNAYASDITETNSTQPRGTPDGGVSPGGNSLDTIVDGFLAPQNYVGDIKGGDNSHYFDWAGSIMALAVRDPEYFAELNISNELFIAYVNDLPGEPDDPNSELGAFLASQNFAPGEITRDSLGKLQPEHKLPITADFCLRCHTPGGWLEGHSEPQMDNFPFLSGDFWGASILEATPHDAIGQFDPKQGTEREMDGVQCDFCHRVYDNEKRQSLHDGSTLSAGNGSFFIQQKSPYFKGEEGPFDLPVNLNTEIKMPRPNEFQETGDFCGSCHDVTNPLIKTKTTVNGQIPDMLHPLERTYTEWKWSAYNTEDKEQCQGCHEPMEFAGAQTWMLYPGIDTLWGDMDQVMVDRGYTVPASRAEILQDALARNLKFMRKKTAKVEILDGPSISANAGDNVTVEVKITNKAGHKLPTGYAEGRQMWIHLKAIDENGGVVFENGQLNAEGNLVGLDDADPNYPKVYEQIALAEGYEAMPSVVAKMETDGIPGLSTKEKKLHFILQNDIVKDNRIPPKGYNKAAYQADGAFIIPENLYADGQNWDITPYTFAIPANTSGNINVTATVFYQTTNHEYANFLKDHDKEETVENGGRARNIPFGRRTIKEKHWGQVTFNIWENSNNGNPVTIGKDSININVQ